MTTGITPGTMKLMLVIMGWLIAMNLLAMLLFMVDKRRSETGGWRIPERRLLAVIFWGGSPGALLARRRLRHKIRKQPFVSQMWGIIALQILALGLGVLLWTQPSLRVWVLDSALRLS